jgi:hypothetical protein
MIVRYITRMFLAVLSMATLAQPSWAAALDKRYSYDSTREGLIKLGYKALVLKHSGKDFFCNDGLCERYPEVLSCLAAGKPACRMVFFRPSDGKYLLVITDGDAAPLIFKVMIDSSEYDMADIRARQ